MDRTHLYLESLTNQNSASQILKIRREGKQKQVMGIQVENRRVDSVNWSMSTKLCDSCKSATALLFCRADSAFLCMSCDSNIHSANKLSSKHERVWMCEVCESAPASFTCKADAASLCVSCDRDIHSANPLARRHQRIPVVPFYESANNAALNFLVVPDHFVNGDVVEEEDVKNIRVHNDDDDDIDQAASSLPPNNTKLLLAEAPDLIMKSGIGVDYLFSDVDSYLDLDYPAGDKFQNHNQNCSVGSVVPVLTNPIQNTDYSYNTQSFSHSLEVSSSEVGVVPDSHCNSMTDHHLNHDVVSSNGVTSTGNGIENQLVVTQLTGLDREARVLRYREKRKNRKFEKTIRYASRKAYAETRPRIKGRFAKRTENEIEDDNQIDRMFNSNSSSGFMIDSGYGIVPSF